MTQIKREHSHKYTCSNCGKEIPELGIHAIYDWDGVDENGTPTGRARAFDPARSRDPNNLLKDKVYNWFFKGEYQEREIVFNDLNQMEKVLDLIKQAYKLV